MCIRGPASEIHRSRVKRAQAHGTRKALDRRFRFAEPALCPAAEIPCLCQIGIERKGSIDQGGACPKIANKKR